MSMEQLGERLSGGLAAAAAGAATAAQAAQAAGQAAVEHVRQMDRREQQALAAGALAGAGVLAVLVVHRRRRRKAAAAEGGRRAAVAHVQLGPADAKAPKGQPPAGAAPAGSERPAGDITTLAELQALPSFRLFAAPVASVRVTHQGAALAAVHASLCALRELRELDLQGNALTALPPALGNLTALTRLCLAGNQLRELPAEIGKLQALEDLDVSGNRLAALPDSIGQLRRLRFLNALRNQLTALPDAIGGCTALVRLGLKSNRLASLPPGVGKLAALKELYLTDNELEALPREVGGMASLVKLQASFNRLRSLPAELGSLPHLEMVRAASCLIQEVPAALGAAPKLAWMSLASNPACRQLAPRAPPVVELGELEMGPKLGDGASGEVFEAHWGRRPSRVAVKIFVAERSPDGHSRDEMAVAFSLSDRHVVKVLAQLKEPLGLVMEFAEGQPIALKPNLQSLLRCRWAPDDSFQLGWVLKVAIGVASALEHMHYRGICHGDVYAHNVMADAEGHAVLCDYGASFAYRKGGPVRYEAQEVRAFGLMLADMAQRLDIGFEGLDKQLELQRELLAVVHACTGSPPVQRPTFGAVGRRLRSLLKQAARAGVTQATPRTWGSDTASMASAFTPRTCVTEPAFTPRSPFPEHLRP